MDVRENTRERALAWRGFVRHCGLSQEMGAAMLRQNKFLSNGATLRTWGAACCAPTSGSLPWPHTGGEAANGAEVKIFVELDGGAVLRGYGEGEFAKFHGAQGFRGSLHEHAAQAMALVSGEDADLRGVAD